MAHLTQLFSGVSLKINMRSSDTKVTGAGKNPFYVTWIVPAKVGSGTIKAVTS